MQNTTHDIWETSSLMSCKCMTVLYCYINVYNTEMHTLKLRCFHTTGTDEHAWKSNSM